MAYTSLPEIQRKLELSRALAATRSNNTATKSGSITSGLANVLNQYRSGKLAKQATEEQSANEQMRTAEMQRLRDALTGASGPQQPLGMMSFETPEVSDLATNLELEKALAASKQAQTLPNMGVTPIWGQGPDGSYIPMQLSSQGGISAVNLPEGVRALPGAGLAAYDENLIARRGTAQTGVDVQNIQATTDPRAAQAGAIEAATQAARIGALPEQLAIQNQAEVSGVAATEQAQRQRDANSVISLLDMAEPLLEGATGSTAGNLRDQAAALVGVSTEGAESAAQLKALGGLLISKMPRMQGPQSNLDVQLYREMAGQIGDPTIPVPTRRAAMQTIRMLNEKYAGDAAQMPAEPSMLTPEEQAELDQLRQRYGRP